jgi:hypothetical protein
MGCTIQHHIGKKPCLVNLTGICARRSDPNGDFIFLQIRKIVAGTVSGYGLFGKIPSVVGPQGAIVQKKYMYTVPFFMGYFGKLKTSCRCIHIVSAECIDEICHVFLLHTLSRAFDSPFFYPLLFKGIGDSASFAGYFFIDILR